MNRGNTEKQVSVKGAERGDWNVPYRRCARVKPFVLCVLGGLNGALGQKSVDVYFGFLRTCSPSDIPSFKLHF